MEVTYELEVIGLVLGVVFEYVVGILLVKGIIVLGIIKELVINGVFD